MPNVNSPHWNWETGVCSKHNLPQVPCPACMSSNDPELEFSPTPIERDSITEPHLIAVG